jgi:hypothetical protein
MSASPIPGLTEPEYLHVLLNPIPIYGLVIGVLALAISLLLRKRQAQLAAMWVIVVSAGSALPTYLTGQSAYHEMYLVVDSDGQTWLDDHRKRAERSVYLLYGASAVALSGALISTRFRKTSFALTILTLLLGAASILTSGWIAHAGGKIRHSEFRESSGRSLTPENH